MPNRKSKKTSKVVKITVARKPAKARRRSSRARPNLSALAGLAGRALGGPLGGAAASVMAHIMGRGAYSVNRNSLTMGNGPPSFSTNGDDVIIKHREFVTDVLSTTTTLGQLALPLNPANATTFPWLSAVASSFEEYEFLGLIFEFKTTSGSAIASTNNALGTVILCTDYNVLNTAPSTKRACETLEFSTSSAPSECMIHPIECAKDKNVLLRGYCTSTSVAGAAGDARLDFLGQTYLSTIGMQAAAITVGELWVSYQVRLARPVFPSMSLDLSLEHGRLFTHQSCAFDPFLTSPTVVKYVNDQYGRPDNLGLTDMFQIFPGMTQTDYPDNSQQFGGVTRYPGGLYLLTVRYTCRCASVGGLWQEPAYAPVVYNLLKTGAPGTTCVVSLDDTVVIAPFAPTFSSASSSSTGISPWCKSAQDTITGGYEWIFMHQQEFRYDAHTHPYGFIIYFAPCSNLVSVGNGDVCFIDTRMIPVTAANTIYSNSYSRGTLSTEPATAADMTCPRRLLMASSNRTDIPEPLPSPLPNGKDEESEEELVPVVKPRRRN